MQGMKVSLSGLLRRLKGKEDQMFMVEEFISHFEIARQANIDGKRDIVNQFFALYVTDNNY